MAILSSYTMSLFATFMLGADGTISGMGSVAADLQAELFAQVQRGDVEAARKINDRLAPMVQAFYAPPFVDMHNRMKEALAMLGRIPARWSVRPSSRSARRNGTGFGPRSPAPHCSRPQPKRIRRGGSR